MSKRGVLVTGGAGFIGSFVADECLKLGMRVTVLDDLSGGYRRNVPARAAFVKGSVTDAPLIDRLFKKHRFDTVYHLAAYAAEGLSHFIRRFNYENNLIGSMNLLNAAVNHGSKCFVFTSSIAVYGRNQLPMRESLVPHPEDPYGISKAAVEHDLKAAKEMFGLDYVIFRPHNVYGERQNIADRYRNVIGIFMNQILKGEPLTIFGDGRQTRAFSYISDVAPAIARAPLVRKSYGEIFNVGADKPYTLNELASAVKKAMGVPNHPVRHLPARNEVKHAWSDHSKAQRTFGGKKAVPLDEGIRRMTAWVRRHGARASKSFGKIEIPRGLPPSWASQTKKGRT